MKVKELIAQLQAIEAENPGLDAVAWSDDQECYTDTDAHVAEVVEDEDGCLHDANPGHAMAGTPIRKVVSFAIYD